MATGPFWNVVAPVEKTNLLTNPSFERGSTPFTAIAGATAELSAERQQFGAWSLLVLSGGVGTSGGAHGTWTAGNGTDYTVSAYLRPAPVAFTMAVGDSNGVNFVASQQFTGGGTWHRYNLSFTSGANAVRRLVVRGTNTSLDYYIDGQQVEVGSLTTYIDGDQDGCYWSGAVHNSQSVRSGTYRGGGSVIPLQSLGMLVDEEPGIGMPPQEITAQSYALLPGAEFQRARASERSFALQTTFIGSTQQDLHVVRRRVFNMLKIDKVDPQQPTRFWYTGAEGTVTIDAVYAGGGEFTGRQGFSEVTPLRFVAHDPYWYAPTQEGTALAAQVNIGSTNNIAARDPLGRWGTLGQGNGSTTNSLIRAIAIGTDQTVYIGGAFSTVGGTLYPGGIGRYFPSSNTFGTLLGGTLNANDVYALAFAPDNTLYIGGDQTTAGGTASFGVSKYTTQFGTLTGGTIGNLDRVYALLYSSTGTLYVGGTFNTAGGTTARYVARWANAVWGTLAGQAGGTIDSPVMAFAYSQTNTLYIAGSFTKGGGTTANGILSWNGAFGTLAGGVTNASATVVRALAIAPDERLYLGGEFGSAGGGSVQHIANWNGVSYAALANGVGNNITGAGVSKILPIANGQIFIGGESWSNVASNRPLLDNMTIWNGYTYLPLDINLFRGGGQDGIINDAALGLSGTLYVVGQFSGSALCASVAQVINTGMGDAYPTLQVRNTGAGTVRMYQFGNTLTGDMLYFDLVLQPSESITLITEPGARSFTSSFRGNIFGQILGGSNIASLRLLSGTNYLSFYCNSGSVATSVYWTPRHDSADGGTVY